MQMFTQTGRNSGRDRNNYRVYVRLTHGMSVTGRHIIFILVSQLKRNANIMEGECQ